jgi:predicted nuclease of predicted toxin-antitoxin system
MTIWIDAQLSPAIAAWVTQKFAVDTVAVRSLGLRDSEDEQIFLAARKADAIVMTKDSDFLLLLDKYGTPPKIIWLTCGNTSNSRLKEILESTLKTAIELLESGENIVEINSI